MCRVITNTTKVGYILMGIKIQMMAYKSNSNIVTQDLSRLL